jgi:hypothetical protein
MRVVHIVPSRLARTRSNKPMRGYIADTFPPSSMGNFTHLATRRLGKVLKGSTPSRSADEHLTCPSGGPAVDEWNPTAQNLVVIALRLDRIPG